MEPTITFGLELNFLLCVPHMTLMQFQTIGSFDLDAAMFLIDLLSNDLSIDRPESEFAYFIPYPAHIQHRTINVHFPNPNGLRIADPNPFV